MENKNTIIAVVLMLVVWVGFSLLFPSPSPPPAQAPAPDATVGTPLEPETTVRAPEPQSPEATMKAGFEGGEVRDIIVENDVFRGVISTS